MNLGGKNQIEQSSCPFPYRSGFYITKEGGTFLASGDNIIMQIKYEKISAISQGHLSHTPQMMYLWGVVKIALYSEFQNLVGFLALLHTS